MERHFFIVFTESCTIPKLSLLITKTSANEDMLISVKNSLRSEADTEILRSVKQVIFVAAVSGQLL